MNANVNVNVNANEKDNANVIGGWTPRWLGRVSVVLAGIYLACVWLDATGTGVPRAILPGAALEFVQVAELFAHAAENAIEYRVNGYRCATGKFEELDVRPFFPIHGDDKESRLDRAMFFFLKDKRVHAALDRYLSASQADNGDRIGGVMILSLRLPIPPVGEASERYRRQPLASYGHELRHYWYITPRAEWDRRCRESP